MMTITTYQIYSYKNKQGVEEPVCNCLDLNRAKTRVLQMNQNQFRFLTALPPYGIRILEYENIVTTGDNLLF